MGRSQLPVQMDGVEPKREAVTLEMNHTARNIAIVAGIALVLVVVPAAAEIASLVGIALAIVIAVLIGWFLYRIFGADRLAIGRLSPNRQRLLFAGIAAGLLLLIGTPWFWAAGAVAVLLWLALLAVAWYVVFRIISDLRGGLF